MTIGTAWTAGDNVEVPDILPEVMGELCHPRRGISSIQFTSDEDDPSASRDITDPIYHPCWWRSRLDDPVELNGISLLNTSFHPKWVSLFIITEYICS
jgi:hypothetical protein